MFELMILMVWMGVFFLVSLMLVSGVCRLGCRKNVTVLLGVLGIITTSASLFLGFVEIKTEYNMYIQEGECITKLVQLGIERSEIRTLNGKCWRR